MFNKIYVEHLTLKLGENKSIKLTKNENKEWIFKNLKVDTL